MIFPCVVVPETTGAVTIDGGAIAATVAVSVEVAGVDPPVLVAVTVTSIVSPTSAACRV